MSLNTHHALITGASQGLGLAIAQALLQAGAKVSNWSRHAPKYTHSELRHISCDCQQADAIAAAWAQLESGWGAPRFFIYNTGVGYYGPTQDMSCADWDRLVQTNLSGAFYALRHVIPALKSQKGGHIIFIGSVAGMRGTPQLGAYCATKFALRGLAESLMLELRYDNIKVSYIAPGSIDTPFFDDIDAFANSGRPMQAEWVAHSVIDVLQSPANYLPSYLEVRPLQPNPPQTPK